MTANALVYVVDDQPKIRDVVAKVVRAFGYEVEAFESASDFLAAFQTGRPACLLLDVHLAEGTGFDLMGELDRRGARVPIVFMTGAGTIPMSVQAMKAGAVEFLTKPLDWDALRAALQQALARAEALAAAQAEENRLRDMLRRLTPRESAVLPHVVRGTLNKQIAVELSIVEQTVKVHRARIMQKLEVDSVASLVRLADQCRALGVELGPATESRSTHGPHDTEVH